jgi:hypothetical protein
LRGPSYAIGPLCLLYKTYQYIQPETLRGGALGFEGTWGSSVIPRGL